MNVEDYRSNKKSTKIVKKITLKKGIKRFITKSLIVIILFLITLILIKDNTKYKNNIIKYVYENNLKFTKFKSLYEKYFGKILSIDKVSPNEEKVFSEKISYKKSNVYKDGVLLNVNNNYMVPTLESGIVVFIGEKEGYGNTIIIEQINGIDVWYSNINISKAKLYDYIEKGTMIGEVKGNKLYMVFQKEGKYLNYKEYI